MSDKPHLFVVLPFDDEHTEIYEDNIKPVYEDHGYEVSKADTADSQRNILEDIVAGISNANLVIADLTGLNLNVFYEVGISHGLGVPTVLLTQDLEEVPFDLNAYYTIEYSRDYKDMEELVSELDDIAEKHLENEIDFESPVSDFADISVSQMPVAGIETSEETDADELEMGVLDYAVEAEDRRSTLEQNLEHIISETGDLESQMVDLTSRINSIAEEQNQVSPKRANRLAREAADEIESYTDSIDDRVDNLEDDLSFMMESMETFVEFSDMDNEEHRNALEEHQNEIREFRTETSNAIDGVEEFKGEITQLRGISRKLTQACNGLSSILSDLIDTLTEANARADRLLGLIDQKLEEYNE